MKGLGAVLVGTAICVVCASSTGAAGERQPRDPVVAVVLGDDGRRQAAVRADGPIEHATPDGRGGWYVAGGFDRVGGLARDGLVRLDSAGRVDPSWRASLAYTQVRLAFGHGRVYVVGDFVTVNGVSRRRGVAALDARTGAVDRRWKPAVWGADASVALASGRVFLSTGYRVVAVDPVTGRRRRGFHVRVRPPTEGPGVWALTAAGGRLFAGGRFLRVNAVRRTGVARLAPRNGRVVRRWRPPLLDTSPCYGCNGDVQNLASTRRRLYVFGGFRRAGKLRTPGGLAALDARTGRRLGRFRPAWPGRDEDGGVGQYEQGAVVGGRLFVSGGARSNGFVTLDARTGRRLPSWRPASDRGFISTVAASRSRVLVGGDTLAR